ncbi:acylneuraminate cytidylyltransferase [Candidatus Magnetobacterium bavaricum]|uniref:Acylneuraminate cytidylyltransferase n=1 Tax=Candidatus Magnetobacterium bavaricum TaxID=29290 RepID=A0A0F3GI62_9BACT|nr:acylneuraminate cytidylyltransferase [Candidatus Magnetobacterium bavaricum]
MCKTNRKYIGGGVSTKTVAFVPVRLTSTRLPKKHFKHIGDRMLLRWVVHRLRECRSVDQIVICAPNESESEQLREFARDHAVELFIYDGDVNDVVGRLTAAAVLYDADICVLASGDCPLLNPGTIELMVDSLRRVEDVGYVVFEPINGVFPIHEGIIVARRWMWELAEKLSNTPHLREHHFPVYVQNVYPERFAHIKRLGFRDEEVFYSLKHRISVDTPSDLDFMNRLHDVLTAAGKEFSLKGVIELIGTQPHLREINAAVHQKAYNEASVKVLYYVEASPLKKWPNGDYDTLLRALAISRALVERFGVGVRFLVQQQTARDFLEARGFTTFLGGYDTLHEVQAQFKYDTVVFALNTASEIPEGFIYALKTPLDIKTVVISNEPNDKTDVGNIASEIANL